MNNDLWYSMLCLSRKTYLYNHPHTGLSGKFLIEALRQSREDAYSYTLIKACTVMIYTLADVMRETSDVTYFPSRNDMYII